MSEAGDAYDSAWNELRRRRRGVLRPIAFIMCLAVALVGLNLVVGIPPWMGLVIFPAVVIPWGYLVIGMFRLFAWPCPRCGRRFHEMAGLKWRPGDRCHYCGLHEFESKEWQRIDSQER